MEVKSLAEAPGIPGATPFEVDDGALALRERARRFAEDVLMPLEEEAERRAGRLPDERRRPGQARGDRRRAERRPARPRARRAGVDPARVGAGRGAVRPDHERDPLARAERLQRLGPRQRRADRPLPSPGAPRRAQGRLRGDRARRRLGPVRDRGHRPPHRGRLPAQRREVVRDRGRRRLRLPGGGQRGRGRRAAADDLRRRPRPAGGRDRRQPRLHPQLSRGTPDDPLPRRRGRRGRADRRRGRRR